MKDNEKLFMPLNIQLFAESNDGDMDGSAESEPVDGKPTEKKPTETVPQEKKYSRDELNKILNAERNKIKEEIKAEYESQKSEAEKLAKMDADQKLNYELDLKTKENEELKNQLNAMTLKSQATALANEKGLPLGYIEDLDFAKETAESINEKIDKLIKVRSNDLDGYLKDKLKQPSPKAIDDKNKTTDPYVQGFKNYKKK